MTSSARPGGPSRVTRGTGRFGVFVFLGDLVCLFVCWFVCFVLFVCLFVPERGSLKQVSIDEQPSANDVFFMFSGSLRVQIVAWLVI